MIWEIGKLVFGILGLLVSIGGFAYGVWSHITMKKALARSTSAVQVASKAATPARRTLLTARAASARRHSAAL
jgi:hypothetical protein